MSTTQKSSASTIPMTPDMARRLLERNTRNRPVSQHIVAGYARDMRAGAWHLTGEAIKIATDGTLLDGQHRLHAVIQAEKTVPMLVVRGVAKEAQAVMDTGRKRSAADMLAISGEANTTLLASSARLALEFNFETLEFNHYGPSHSEIAQFVDAHPELHGSVDIARRYARKADCLPSVVAFTHWWLSQTDPLLASAFWEAAGEKVGLHKGDPITAMTNRLAEARRGRQSLSKTILVSLVVRAWNSRRRGVKQNVMRVNSPAGGIVPIPRPL